tara:strand:- start:25 stop:147 length:123 start_codon:yes stop_codon:yes gene_type:complete
MVVNIQAKTRVKLEKYFDEKKYKPTKDRTKGNSGSTPPSK